MTKIKEDQEQINQIVDRIDELRTKCGYSQFQLATAAGVQVNTIKRIYHRDIYPSLATLQRLCEAFEIDFYTFFAYMKDTSDQTQDEKSLINSFNEISKESQIALLKIVRQLK